MNSDTPDSSVLLPTDAERKAFSGSGQQLLRLDNELTNPRPHLPERTSPNPYRLVFGQRAQEMLDAEEEDTGPRFWLGQEALALCREEPLQRGQFVRPPASAFALRALDAVDPSNGGEPRYGTRRIVVDAKDVPWIAAVERVASAPDGLVGTFIYAVAFGPQREDPILRLDPDLPPADILWLAHVTRRFCAALRAGVFELRPMSTAPRSVRRRIERTENTWMASARSGLLAPFEFPILEPATWNVSPWRQELLARYVSAKRDVSVSKMETSR
jgi:hypothetical protein